MRTADQIRAELKKLIADQQKCEIAVIPDSACLSELGFDSLDVIYLMMNIEDRFVIRFHEKEFRQIQTLAEAVLMIQRLASDHTLSLAVG